MGWLKRNILQFKEDGLLEIVGSDPYKSSEGGGGLAHITKVQRRW